MWQCGPEWLSLSHEFWPEGESDDFSNEVEASVFTVQSIEPTVNEAILHLEKYSNIEKVLRITAYVKGLKSAELIEAEKYWIQSIQQRFFSQELIILKNKMPLDPNSKILTLNPFLDNEGIIRLGGRLHDAPLPYKTKHPIIIPKNLRLPIY
nr:unnamed protein product [Callosobruchus analis]